ncbi:hypothetical protein [Paenibacillus sp. y28]|uniref:hypothetical protein n=1 Tax=Paenibacillus sp. y28 TaxID=3129110 RepID=UPI0030162ADC
MKLAVNGLKRYYFFDFPFDLWLVIGAATMAYLLIMLVVYRNTSLKSKGKRN